MRTIIAVLLLTSAASAEETIYVYPRIPTEEQKIEALKLGYVLNGNSMVGRTIDLTKAFAPAVELVAPPIEKIKPANGSKRK